MTSDNIIFFHGFTQTKRSYNPFLKELTSSLNNAASSRHFNFITFDLPGHGDSSNVASNFDQIERLIEPFLPAHFFGYSLGARLALKNALDHTDAVTSIALVSCNPGIRDADQRSIRKEQDETLADRISKMNQAEYRQFIEEWVSQPLFGTHRPGDDDIEARVSCDPKSIADSLINFGQGNFDPIWNIMTKLKSSDTKVLILAGEKDEKYRDIARDINSTLDETAELNIIKNCFHSPHLEDPKLVASVYSEFLNR